MHHGGLLVVVGAVADSAVPQEGPRRRVRLVTRPRIRVSSRRSPVGHVEVYQVLLHEAWTVPLQPVLLEELQVLQVHVNLFFIPGDKNENGDKRSFRPPAPRDRFSEIGN